ncbi:MAG TPA: hypothetical protein VF893_00275 [Candidatus Bathyarchaeia archaeon]
MRNDNDNTEFILFPMVHVGTKEYYDDISRRLASCNLILAEGVNSKKIGLLTLSYRIVQKIRRMDLVTQSEGIHISSFRNKILNYDMTKNVFDDRWSSLPLGIRAQIFAIVPLFIVYLLFFGTRKIIAQNIALQDLPAGDETLLQDENFEKLDDLLIDERDQKLIDSIEKLHDAHRIEKRTVGVVYGAMHMRHVVSFLFQKWHYRIAKAEWITVFDF